MQSREGNSSHHGEIIWRDGAPPEEIIRNARKKFRESGNHVALASDYYSQVKRVRENRKLFLQYSFLAIFHATLGYFQFLKSKNFDQLDVITRIYSQVPFKPFRLWCRWVLRRALSISPPNEMAPHTRGLLLVTFGQTEISLRKALDSEEVLFTFYHAVHLRKDVLQESGREMAARQWCRIAQGVGFYFYDLSKFFDQPESSRGSSSTFHEWGAELIQEALTLAKEYAPSQLPKIREGLARRGFNEKDFEIDSPLDC